MYWIQFLAKFQTKDLPLLRLFCRFFNKPLIQVQYDCGFGHKLFIRGELPGLSWSRGKELINLGPNLWVWVADSYSHGLFKILLDDQIYEDGSNHQLLDHAGAFIRPNFSAKDSD